MPFVKSKPPLPTRSLRFLRAAVHSTSPAFWLHHAHPFVAAAERRPVLCREAEGLVTELWYPRFGLQDIDCDLVGLEVGLPAFQLPIFENVRQCRKEIYGTC